MNKVLEFFALSFLRNNMFLMLSVYMYFEKINISSGKITFGWINNYNHILIYPHEGELEISKDFSWT